MKWIYRQRRAVWLRAIVATCVSAAAALMMKVCGLSWWLVLPAIGIVFGVLITEWPPLRVQAVREAEPIRQLADRASALLGDAAAVVNKEHKEDHEPSRSKWTKWIVSLLLAVGTVISAILQLTSGESKGWWWTVSSFVFAAFWLYLGKQVCRPKTVGRKVCCTIAGGVAGVALNFMCTAMGVMPNSDRQLEEIRKSIEAMQARLNGQSETFWTRDESQKLNEILNSGDDIRKADALILLAADDKNSNYWTKARELFGAITKDREMRGQWRSAIDNERYLILRGDLAYRHGDPDGAISSFKEATEANVKSARVWNRFGCALSEAVRGDLKQQETDAISAFRKAIDLAGQDDLTAIEARSNLALSLRERADEGDLAEAKALLEEALKRAENTLGGEHQYCATIGASLASVLYDLADFKGAEERIRKAVTVGDVGVPRDHPIRAPRLSLLAMILLQRNQIDDAKKFMEEAIKIESAKLPLDDPRHVKRLSGYGSILRVVAERELTPEAKVSGLKLAEAQFLEAIRINALKNPPDHYSFVNLYSNLAGIMKVQGRYAESTAKLEEAIEIAKKRFGAVHEEIAKMLSNLASTQIRWAQVEREKDRKVSNEKLLQARKNLEQALAIDLLKLPADHPNVALRYKFLGDSYKVEENCEEACRWWSKAYDILKQLPANHAWRQEIERVMAACDCARFNKGPSTR